MKYAISKVYITPAKYAVDGKQHRHKLWYAGVKDYAGFQMKAWEKKKERIVFCRKADAMRVAKALGSEAVVETIK